MYLLFPDTGCRVKVSTGESGARAKRRRTPAPFTATRSEHRMTEVAVRRSTSERIEHVLALLSSEMDAWIASADPDGTGYLIPLTFFWDEAALIYATPVNSRTARN